VGYTAVGPGRRWILALAAVAVVAVIGGVEYLVIRHFEPSGAAPTATGAALPLRSGVPVPERHNAAGAATAAENYQVAGFRVAAGTLDARTAAAVLLAEQATPAATAVLAEPTRTRDQLARQRSTFAPASAVVQAYTPDQAVVQVWGVAAQSSQTTPQPGGTEDWGSTTITLLWDGAQWRVGDQHYQPGPWPVRNDDRMVSTTGDFSFRFRESAQGWSYVPDA
jgi:hypothetical protein